MHHEDMREILYPDEDEESDPNQSDPEDECAWVDLAPEVPNPIDEAIQSCIEQHRRKAAQFNMVSMIRALHPTYLALKHWTENWTSKEAENLFVNCRCPPSNCTQQLVDLIDIMGVFFSDCATFLSISQTILCTPDYKKVNTGGM
jgi:hypothetical protein